MKFTLQCLHENGTKVTHEFTQELLTEVLDSIEDFLRGCGFIADGVLDFVSDGDFRDSEVREVEKHSPAYYDYERNRPLKRYNEDYCND